MKINIYFCLIFIALTFSSCDKAINMAAPSQSFPTSSSVVSTLGTKETPSISPILSPASKTTAFSTATATVMPSSTLSPTIVVPPLGLPIISNQSGDLYSTVFSIPVGDNSLVKYQGVGIPDMEITGPNAIAILPDDTFMIGDLIGNRLLHFDQKGNLLNRIELTDLGIANISDLRAKDDELYLLEISLSFSPERYRVNQLSLSGKLIASYDIPEGFHLENGLTGISLDCDGSILIEIEGGFFLYRLQDIQKKPANSIQPVGYNCDHKEFREINYGSPRTNGLMVGDTLYKTQFTTKFGGIQILNIFQDGSFFLRRDDVINSQKINVDVTVHYIGADSIIRGVTRVPISEGYYPIHRNIVTNERGEAFVLLPRRNSLDVIQLNFFKSLEPLPPSTIVPEITATNKP